MTYKGYKVKQWQTERMEQPHPIRDKDRDQPQPQNAVRQRHIHLNWSKFIPEFSGKPEEDAETHLLHSND